MAVCAQLWHTHTHTHTHTYTYTHIHTHTHTSCTYKYYCTYIILNTTHTHIHTHIHMHAHTTRTTSTHRQPCMHTQHTMYTCTPLKYMSKPTELLSLITRTSKYRIAHTQLMYINVVCKQCDSVCTHQASNMAVNPHHSEACLQTVSTPQCHSTYGDYFQLCWTFSAALCAAGPRGNEGIHEHPADGSL